MNCECGKPTFITSTGECQPCYNRRWRTEHPDYYQRRHRERYQPKPRHARALSMNIGYTAAHDRIRAAKGSASKHNCVDCGAPAEEWSYRGGSPDERIGTRTRIKNGNRHTVESTWCGDPDYYDPMCRPCHARRDGHEWQTGYRFSRPSTPASTTGSGLPNW